MKYFYSLFCFVLTLPFFAQTNTEIFLFDIELKASTFKINNGKNISNNQGYDNQPSFIDNQTFLYASTKNGQTDIVKSSISDFSKTWINTTEGGEYTPLKIPNKNSVSAVRLDKDGKQRLYAYNLSNGKSTELIKDMVVAYYTWYNENIIVSAVIENNHLNLYVHNLKKGTNKKLASNVGRSFHKIPNSNLISFISKENENQWEIKSINPKTGKIKSIANTMMPVEDICWLNSNTVLSGKNSTLYQLKLNQDKTWQNVEDLSAFGISKITRLTSNTSATKLLITGDISTEKIKKTTHNSQTLEPKLEHIKWISGTWHGEAFGGITEEIWSEPSGGSMMATFKLIKDGKVIFYEIEVIREIENSLILQLKHFGSDLKGWEPKDETIDFPLIKITENKVVFEGMTFEKVNDTEMNIYVDIEDKGKTETITFNYKKKTHVPKQINRHIPVKKAQTKPVIDGKADDAIWSEASWLPLDQLWLGKPYTKDDFYGRYKLSWAEDGLYLLAEITDDVLIDNNPNPLINWWDDDCLEIFVDEDNSGGNHQYNHNAFAYHIALDGHVVDMAPEKTGKLYNSHLESKRVTTGSTSVWEVKISLYNDTYKDGMENTPSKLYAGKQVGFALAYCDNDTSKTRENFIGSVYVKGKDKNRGWIDANIFGTLKLIN